MPVAPEAYQGAVRQTRRAALSLAAIAALALAAWHAAPGLAAAGEIGVLLALALAGFMVTRLATGTPDPRATVRDLARVWAAVALWGVPALVVVILAVLLAGVMLSPPSDLHGQAWTALWTAAGTSGTELIKQGAYEPEAGGDLLMHGWLLGAAAQLAVGWTVVVTVLRRLGLGRWVAAVTGIGAVASLALDIMMRRQGFDLQAFYLAPPRAWPFLVGAAAALVDLKPSRAAGGRLGPIPDVLERLGVIALPFYLWAWPLLAFPRLVLARPLTGLETVAALAGALLLAEATHRWVESPLRRRLRDRPLASLGATAAALATVGAIAATIFAMDGLPGRATAEVRAEEAGMDQRPPLSGDCHTEGEAIPPAIGCTVPAGADARVVLWGNSHASHLGPAVFAWGRERGLAVRQATRSGCLPVLSEAGGLADEACVHFNRAAIEAWGRGEPPDVILVGAAWTLMIDRAGLGSEDGLEVMTRGVDGMIDALRASVGEEARIVLLGSTPDYRFSPAACHARRAFLGLDTVRCDRAPADNAALAAAVDAALEGIAARRPGVSVFRPWIALCDGAMCRTRSAATPWYADANHLTEAGGLAQLEALRPVLNDAVSAGPR